MGGKMSAGMYRDIHIGGTDYKKEEICGWKL